MTMTDIPKLNEILSTLIANPDTAYRDDSFPRNTAEAPLVLTLLKQIDAIKRQAEVDTKATFKPNTSEETQVAAIAKAQSEAVKSYLELIKDNANKAYNNEQTAPTPDATQNVLKGTVEGAATGLIGGGGIMSGLMGGFKSAIVGFVFSIPFVGKLMEQATEYVRSWFDSDKLTWQEAGEKVENSRTAIRIAEATKLDPAQLLATLTAPKELKINAELFDYLDAQDGKTDNNINLAVLDKNHDRKLDMITELGFGKTKNGDIEVSEKSMWDEFREVAAAAGMTFDETNSQHTLPTNLPRLVKAEANASK